jgi:exodeoxyribonuclease-3
MKRLVSWNVNGVRAAAKAGLIEFIGEFKPDILCLQEIKAELSQFPAKLLDMQNKYYFFINPAKKAGYSGVATITKIKPLHVKFGLDIEIFDNEGRVIICEFEKYLLYNVYFPNGRRDHSRVDFKLDFSQKLFEHAFKLSQKLKKPFLICGDLNTAHQEIDLANPKTNQKTTGFLPRERSFVDEIINQGIIDLFRYFYPLKKDAYTWWSYRSNCRSRNIGWRLDYFFSTEKMIDQISDCIILDQIKGSDHCPVMLEAKL